MDKYEYRLKAEQIEKLVKKKNYKAAAKIADSIDWRRVKNLNMLYIVADIYDNQQRYEDCMEILNIAYDKAPVGRMLVYKMVEIATKMHMFDDAIELYREFVRLAPHDQSRYILKYQIYRERGSSLEDQITILNDYKTHEYQEQWAYELAARYAEAGRIEECIRECDEMILWFSEGEYVVKAMELKMQYEPLTAYQQDLYDHRQQHAEVPLVNEDDFEEPKVADYDTDRFSTTNLQAELAANLDMVLEPKKEEPKPAVRVVEPKIPEETGEIELEDLEIKLEDVEIEDFAIDIEEPEEIAVEDIEIEDIAIEDIAVEDIAIDDIAVDDIAVEDIAVEDIAIEDIELEIPEVEAETEEPEIPEIEVEAEEPAIPEVPEIEAEVEELEIPEIEAEVEELEIPEITPEAAEPEATAEEEAEKPEEPQPDKKQETGQLSIDEIIADWETKRAETEAMLKANAQVERERKAIVQQQTVDLVKLIAGGTGTLPTDVQEILDEIEQEKEEAAKAEEPIVTEDDLPQDVDAEEEEAVTFEDLDVQDEEVASADEESEDEEPVVPRRRVSDDTASMNMIQELERALADEVSEMAINRGHLTREQAKLFAYFTSVRGMSQQLSKILSDKPPKGKTNSSSGNLVVTGKQGNGKTTLAISIVKALQKQNYIEGKRLAKISAQKLNNKDIFDIVAKLKGGALIIESAGALSDPAIMALGMAMDSDTQGMLVILEDSADEIDRIFRMNRRFANMFDHSIDIPDFSNDELIAFGKSYAMEQEYVFDEFAVLALYDRVGALQTNSHLVTVTEVKEIIDRAIEHSEKGGVRNFLNRVTKKNVDEFGNRLLREEDFE